MDIKSFSLICTSPCHREALLLILSIKHLYDCPIFIICNTEAKKFLEKFRLGGIYFKTKADPHHLVPLAPLLQTIEEPNSFHNKAVIYRKMDVIEWAIQQTGNTFFLDSDIVLLKEIHQDITHPVMLSPHHYQLEEETAKEHRARYGGFNAGYLFTSEPDFASEWREIYLNRSSFYEQEGMGLLFESFEIGKFDTTHNIGFWRFPLSKGKFGMRRNELKCAKSLHCHFDPLTYRNASKGLENSYRLWAEVCVNKLPEHLKIMIKEFKNTS